MYTSSNRASFDDEDSSYSNSRGESQSGRPESSTQEEKQDEIAEQENTSGRMIQNMQDEKKNEREVCILNHGSKMLDIPQLIRTDGDKLQPAGEGSRCLYHI